MDTIKSYSAEELLTLVDLIVEHYGIYLDEYVPKVALEMFRKTKYYKRSQELTKSLNDGVDFELDDNLKYLDEEVDFNSIANSPNFGQIVSFVSKNSLYKLKIDYEDCADLALEYKNFGAVKYFHDNGLYSVSRNTDWDKKTILVFNYVPEISLDLIYFVGNNIWSSTDSIIFAYYKLRPAEFTAKIMHTILQIKYQKERKIDNKCKLRRLFGKLIDNHDCNVCYANDCNCAKVVPYKRLPPNPGISSEPYSPCDKKDWIKCDKCNRSHYYWDKFCVQCNKCHFYLEVRCDICNACKKEHTHCITCSEILDDFDNCMCI
jgi:hypothetical protein